MALDPPSEDSPLDTPTVSGPAPARTAERDQEVGPYRVRRLLGEGGMGVVYLAEQAEPLKRTVALKVIKIGMDTKAVVSRFEMERQALAMMDHPGIAKVFDAGATVDGRPYFAMEYVPGIPITEYCDRASLGIRDRLELVARVCDAVQHAHQKGIIHRDLKPSNVLVEVVDGEAIPKVIDFGIAKATVGGASDHTAYTELGQIIGTPEYMSPEQAEGATVQVDTRADIYSIGTLLYVLLVGRLPFEVDVFRTSSHAAIERTLREVDPPRPSLRYEQLDDAADRIARRRGTDRGTVLRTVRGDLDWITMKAIEKDPAHRYPSAAELAAEIRRYLADEPVFASPPSVLYRLRKFARRRRAFVLGSGAVAAALVAGVFATAWQAVRATRAEEQARREAATSSAVNRFLTDMLAEANPEKNVRGREVTVREILDGAAATVDELAVDPAVRAEIRSTIGTAYREIGRYDESEAHLRAALDTRRAVAGIDPALIADSVDELGEVIWEQGRYDEIEPLWREAYELRLARFGKNDPLVAASLNNLAALRYAVGDYDGAAELYRESLAIRRHAFGSEHVDVAESLSNLAIIEQVLGRMDESEAHVREALRIYRKAMGDDHLNVATVIDNLAVLLKTQGRLEEAEPLYREALAIRVAALGRRHLMVAASLNNLGRLLQAKGDHGAAEEALQEALAIRRALVGDVNVHTGESLTNLGFLYRDMGRFEEASEMFRQARDVYVVTLGPEHTRLANVLTGWGSVLTEAGRPREAEPLLLEGLRIRSKALGEDHWRTGVARYELGSCLLALGRLDEAEDELLEAERILSASSAEATRGLTDVLASLARLYERTGDVERAERVRAKLASGG